MTPAMTKIERIPEHIMEQARALVAQTGNYPDSITAIAQALLAAEKRGEERERERACKILTGFADSVSEKATDHFEVQLGESIASCADAIRAGN